MAGYDPILIGAFPDDNTGDTGRDGAIKVNTMFDELYTAKVVYDSHVADGSIHFAEGAIDHANILSIGSNSHAAIDSHIADGALHFTKASIDHGGIGGLADDDHTQYLLVDGSRNSTGGQKFNGNIAAGSTSTVGGVSGNSIFHASETIAADTTSWAIIDLAAEVDTTAFGGETYGMRVDISTNHQFSNVSCFRGVLTNSRVGGFSPAGMAGFTSIIGNVAGAASASSAAHYQGATSWQGAYPAVELMYHVGAMAKLGSKRTSGLNISEQTGGEDMRAIQMFGYGRGADIWFGSLGEVRVETNKKNLILDAHGDRSNAGMVQSIGSFAAADPSTLGTELVTNGDFTVGTGWTVGAGWAITGGVADKNAAGVGVLSQTISGLEEGFLYQLQYTQAGIGNSGSSPSSYIRDLPSITISGATIKRFWVDGTYTEYFIATSDKLLAFTPQDSTSRFTIDNVSIKRLTTGAVAAPNVKVGDHVIIDKATGKGIKVDTTTPTYPWHDLLGAITEGQSASKPSRVAYRGGITQYRFGTGDESFVNYHLPHDYAEGTDLFIHVHWSHVDAGVTGGTVDFDLEHSYAKGHQQAAGSVFPASKTLTLQATAEAVPYKHMTSEIQLSAVSPSALQMDTDDVEVDGIIMLRVEVAARAMTGSNPEVFIHQVDIHYQSTNIGTKDKAPDFYT